MNKRGNVSLIIFLVVFGPLFLNLAKAQLNNSTNSTDQNNTNVTVPTNQTNVTLPNNQTEETTNKTTDVDNETAQETETMHTPFGAQVRLLQLEKQIRRRVLWAEAIIEVLANKSINTSELEGIKEELRLLADEAHAAVSAPYTNESVKKFVDIKLDAKDLVKEFREKARQYLTGSDRSLLSQKFNSIDREELKELNEQIKAKIRELNAERIARIHENMNITNRILAERIRAGEIAAREALRELRNEVKNLSAEEKQLFNSKMLKEKEDKLKFRLNQVMEIEEKRFDSVAERLQERANKLKNSDAAQRLENGARVVADRANEIAKQRSALMRGRNR